MNPKFFLAVDKITIEEGPSTVNHTVANNNATDKDLGLNGTIEYTIADGNSEVCYSYVILLNLPSGCPGGAHLSRSWSTGLV